MLKPWTRAALYLADGEGRQPLGWSELTLILQTEVVTLPCVILPARSLAFPAVVGLDFMSLSGLQFNVSQNSYWFRNKKHQYQLLKPSDAGYSPQLAFFSAVAPDNLVSPPSCRDLLQAATNNADLDDFGKSQLLNQLKENSDVYTETLGRTNVLAHKIFLTHEVLIKQKPCWVSPTRLQVIKEHVEETGSKTKILCGF